MLGLFAASTIVASMFFNGRHFTLANLKSPVTVTVALPPESDSDTSSLPQKLCTTLYQNSDFRPAETPRDVPFLFKICTVLFKTPQLCTKPSQRGKTSCIMRYFCTRFTAIQANAFTIIFICIISSFLSSAEADILNFIFSLPAIDFCRVPWTIQSCFVIHGNKEGQCCFAVF